MKALNKFLTISSIVVLFFSNFLNSYSQTPVSINISGSTSVCPGATGVVYSVKTPVSPTEAVAYNWIVPAGVTIVSGANTNSITVNFASSAVSYKIYGYFSSPQGKIAFNDLYITVKSLTAPTGFTGSLIVCPGTNNVNYSISAIPGATGYTWTLPVGASIVSGANTNNITVNFSASAISGDISVCGTNGCSLPGPSLTNRINVGAPIAASTIAGRNFITPGTTVPYSIESVAGATGYSWELPSGATISSGANTNRIMVNFPPSATFGTIKVTPLNGCGNGISSSIAVFVGAITTSGGITINPLTANRNSLLFKTDATNLGAIGSDASLYTGGNSSSFGMYAYGNNNLEFSTNSTKRLVISGSGNIGIGITSPKYKLTVAGTIAAREVKITAEAWADFVFHPTYKLRTLGEVEQFIKANRHLPEIPTEAEVKANGVSVGEMNIKLLQKLEELTLYIIEQQKQIDELKKRYK